MSTTTTHNVQNPKKVLNKSNVANAATVSKTWNITNNTDTGLVAIDAFLGNPSSTEELYQRSLQRLSANDGNQVIQSGATQTITFGEEHMDDKGNALDYTVIIARADNLFPVKILELSLSEYQGSFPDTTVAANDAMLMKQAELFGQTIIAFPSSEMTKAYAAALAEQDAEKIAGFFNTYPQYGAITLAMVTAVQTYYNRYGFVWAGQTGNQSYYLYTSDGTTKKNLGTVSINYKAFVPVTNLDAPEGLTATFTDVNHRNTVLHYSDGQFSDDATSSKPKICLQGLFILKGQLTGLNTDNKLIPVLYGVVDDNQVFGYSEATQLLSADSVPSSISALLDPQGVLGWLKLAGLIAGAMAAVAVLAVTARYIIKAVKKGLAPALTPEEIERLNELKVTKILERMTDAGLKIPDDLTKALDDIKAEANGNLLSDDRAKIQTILKRQSAACNTLLDYGRNDSLTQAWDELELDIARVTVSEPEDMPGYLDTFRQHISKNAKLISDRCNSLGSKIEGMNAKVISDARTTADRLTKSVNTNEDIRADLNDGKLPEIEE